MNNNVERKEKIIEFMRENTYKPLLMDELASVLDVPLEDYPILREILNDLEIEGRIFKTHKKRYGIPDRMNLLSGKYMGNERGFGFVVPIREDKNDIFVPSGQENGAFDGDVVVVRVNKKVFDDRRAEGEIIKILSRSNKTITGYFERNKHFGFVIPDNKRIPKDIFIDKKSFNNAKTGDKVEVEITKWPEKRRNAEGNIIEILGKNNDIATEIYSLMKSYNLKDEYPSDVVAEVENISDSISKSEIKKRRVLSNEMIITIDGEDAKDLDDAVSVELLNSGNYILGVHIADVSHFVKENSLIDKEAAYRATSVYLPDRVIPMLPKRLSNNICSLNPNIDRLTFSVKMEIDKSGKVISHEIFESVIKTKYRMTYNEVSGILNGEKVLQDKYKTIINDIQLMKNLADILTKKRQERGAIDFNIDEIKIVTGENSYPLSIEKRERNVAHKIIEEFMLLCNETVAEQFFWKNSPFVFRIHEKPENEKIETLLEFIYNLGYSFKASKNLHPRNLQKLLEQVKGKPEEKIITNFMLRSMKKARYSNYNEGHFGLSSGYYSHFTSPIRRYPDLIIHRIIKEDINGQMSEKRINELTAKLPEISRHSTDQEVNAEQIERDVEDLLTCIFMKEHIGEKYVGIITNITSSSIYVELDNLVEGAIKLSSMEDDYYIFNQKQYCLVGERTKKVYKIGNKLNVSIVESDIRSRKILLEIDN